MARRKSSFEKKLPRHDPMPQCRCLTCGEWYEQPDLYYVSFDCPTCLKTKGLKRWIPEHLR